MTLRKPYLVQRIKVWAEPHSTKKGVDRYFGFDYMGSAEFEFGTLPTALKQMRSTDLVLERLTVKPHQVWYVGPKAISLTALSFFTDQLGPKRWPLKEWTAIKENYLTPPPARCLAFDGWWALDMDWILFKQKEHAELWLREIKAKTE
jgi:hypothetical protein